VVVLDVEFAQAEAGRLRDAWRDIVDFGELWTGTEPEEFWQEKWGPNPVGEPLRYGCELRLALADSGSVDEQMVRGELRFLVLSEPRESMVPGAMLTLFDGGTPRARGRVTSG